MADRITATVAGSMDKYDLSFAKGEITLFGYGIPQSSTASQYNGQYYLDQSTGWHYRSNGTSWVRQGTTPLPLITDVLESKIDVGVDGITMSVSSDTNGMTTFRLMAGQAVLDTEELYLNVNSANIRGELIADSVRANTTIEAPILKNGHLQFWDTWAGRQVHTGDIYSSYGTIYITSENGINVDSLSCSSGSVIDFSSASMVIMPDNTTFERP
jgi:hypothetical protein